MGFLKVTFGLREVRDFHFVFLLEEVRKGSESLHKTVNGLGEMVRGRYVRQKMGDQVNRIPHARTWGVKSPIIMPTSELIQP